MTNALTLDLIRTIMIEELELDEKVVNIYNQKFRIPTTDGLFVYVEYKGAKILSSRNVINDGGLVILQEEQNLNTLEDITIGLFSRNLEAMQMKERAVMALFSVYAQQLQEENSFKIFQNPVLTPLSMLEATAQLYRFDIDIKVMAWYQNTKASDFYDKYSVAVRVNDGDPDLTAELDALGPTYLTDEEKLNYLLDEARKPFIEENFYEASQ